MKLNFNVKNINNKPLLVPVGQVHMEHTNGLNSGETPTGIGESTGL